LHGLICSKKITPSTNHQSIINMKKKFTVKKDEATGLFNVLNPDGKAITNQSGSRTLNFGTEVEAKMRADQCNQEAADAARIAARNEKPAKEKN
jgi:hypothetical protein